MPNSRQSVATSSMRQSDAGLRRISSSRRLTPDLSAARDRGRAPAPGRRRAAPRRDWRAPRAASMRATSAASEQPSPRPPRPSAPPRRRAPATRWCVAGDDQRMLGERGRGATSGGAPNSDSDRDVSGGAWISVSGAAAIPCSVLSQWNGLIHKSRKARQAASISISDQRGRNSSAGHRPSRPPRRMARSRKAISA